MVMFWYRECISHGGEKHLWCTSRGGRKVHLVWKVPGGERGCNMVSCSVVKTMWSQDASWSRVDLESKRVSWRYGKKNKLEEQVYDLKKEQ
ncbi:hypothetical protein F2Q69_00055911 [Brassica cretica]|uniref:Uncharacterized protein n=1 Tax=Brassica cretica TaxID=69181 RepID=A0A8S9N4X0_BRACR|nr:hypothetical protein F2Q69_00055911 [Brassica cretica]